MKLPNQQALRLFPLALVLGVSLLGTGFWLFHPAGNPEDSDYRQVNGWIRQHWAEGDALAVRPWWADRLREVLGDLPFLQVRNLEAEDLSKHRRLWVVFLPGREESLQGPFADDRYPVEFTADTGRLLVRRYRLPDPATVLFDFRKKLSEAKVRMLSGGTWKNCSNWILNRWMCSNRDWNYVGNAIIELGEDPREVIWAHASETGPIEITFQEVPGGKTLLIHTGLTPAAARATYGTPVTFRVSVDGQEVLKQIQGNITGYFPVSVDFSRFQEGPHTVTFEVKSPNYDMRQFCFDAEVRG
jgi:hypothetical protein